MSPTTVRNAPSIDELARWIAAAGEDKFIDAKGPVFWDGADTSASLAKDIAALANSRDGGVIVIGKSEAPDGSFTYTGLTPEQSASFETTKVGQWVNARFEPPVYLACYHAEYLSKRFVVIVVREFEDVPTLCIRSFQEAGNPKNHLLREGTLYVRNQNAESKPMQSVSELRALIGLATRKKGDELMPHFNAMLQGKPPTLAQNPSQFEQEIQGVRRELKLDNGKAGWWMFFRPEKYIGNRWPTSRDLERLITKHAVHISGEFPGHQSGTFPMAWGIANKDYGETWALTKSGVFCYSMEFRENHETANHTGYRGGPEAQQPIPPGQWVEFTWAIRTVVEFFLFQSRFVEVFEPGEVVHLHLSAGPLDGRKLVALSGDIRMGYGAPEPCRAPIFTLDKTADVADLRTNWEPTCASILKQFVDLFPTPQDISLEALLKWVDWYKTRY